MIAATLGEASGAALIVLGVVLLILAMAVAEVGDGKAVTWLCVAGTAALTVGVFLVTLAA